MQFRIGNLFRRLHSPPAESESSESIVDSSRVRIARIESNAFSSPDGFWYDQPDDEWVAVIAGDAAVAFDDGTMHPMQPGDWIIIPAHRRHRIVRTDEKTIWLAVHISTNP